MKRFKTLILVFTCVQIYILLSFHGVILIWKLNLMADYLVSDAKKMTEEISQHNSVPTLLVMLHTPNRSIEDDNRRDTLQNSEKDWALFKDQLIFADFQKFYNVSSQYLQDPYIHRHQYKLAINKICNSKQVFLLFVIHSAVFQFQERQFIRSTWASLGKFLNRQIEHVFVLGQTINNTMNTEINIESGKYNDIIQGNFIDTYRNMTYKHVLCLYWITRYCNQAKFVVKVDDDVMVNIPLLIEFLQNKIFSNHTSNILECQFCLSDGPERSLQNKWYTTVDEYPFTKFPPYCTGFAYIITLDIIRKFVEATKLIPFLWIDDVFVGGFLPWVTGVTMDTPTMFNDVIRSSVIRNTTSLFYLFENKWLHQSLWRDQWNAIIVQGNASIFSRVLIN